ncbi:polysaccharide pyruvyl transferase family protein [Enterococcus sp. S86.2]|uniref:polysaccharide pyruvyl transferase family protein n=1 Tax=Enterococcus sp. S86.2 TaxID=3031299 RepID=UPI0026F272F2|nr:polysaccharide pyruvyl transferase family protein [Enterococcus sp. S86.2]
MEIQKETIGILTYHNTQNFGAALQCFALYSACSNAGKYVEIINYRNQYIEQSKGKKNRSLIKDLVQKPLFCQRKKAFENFNSLMTFSYKCYDRKKILADPPKYDKYIVGSDQVWSYKINGGDTTYLLDFVESPNKFTFASSFGVSTLPKDLVREFKENLKGFQYISVRESTGVNLLREIDVKGAVVVNDPVFLLSKSEWIKALNLKNNSTNKKVFSYFLDHHTRQMFENNFNYKNKMMTKLSGGIKLKDFISPNVSVDFSRGPAEFLEELNSADIIYTDSFHATVFSIIMEKPFIVFLRGDEGKDSRIINVLKMFGLEKCIYKEGIDINYIPNLDYNVIRSSVDEAREHNVSSLYNNILNVKVK